MEEAEDDDADLAAEDRDRLRTQSWRVIRTGKRRGRFREYYKKKALMVMRMHEAI